MKYGSSSASDSLSAWTGNLPNICGPGVVWAAAEGRVEYSVGDTGVPVLEVVFEAFSLAEADGTGSQLCAAVG